MELQAHLREGIRNLSPDSNSRGLMFYINLSLMRAFIRIFYGDNKRAAWIRESFESAGFSIEKTVQSFDERVLYGGEGEDVLKWYGENIFLPPISARMDENWGRLLIDKNSLAATFLTSKLTELFYNTFTYCSKAEGTGIDISFSTEEGEYYEYLTINLSSPTGDRDKAVGGSGKGIKSLKEVLEMINFDPDGLEDTKSLETADSGDMYSLKLYMRKGLFIQEV
jgi:hypothetical protein